MQPRHHHLRGPQVSPLAELWHDPRQARVCGAVPVLRAVQVVEARNVLLRAALGPFRWLQQVLLQVLLLQSQQHLRGS